MTENKRFTMCHQQNDKNGWTMSIVDWETNEPFDYTQYEVHSESITNTKDEMEDLCLLLNDLNDENNELKQSVNNLKETIIKITIAYQRKYDRTIVDLVDEVHDEDITDLIKELGND